MAYTAQEVIDMAVERASLNRDSLIPEAQSLQYITTFERRAYTIAAQLNPDYFGKEDKATRSASDADWDLKSNPGDVGSIKRIEISSITGSMSSLSVGDEVYIVDLSFPDVQVSPRVAVRDYRIVEHDDELTSDSNNYVDGLKLFYSKFPQKVTDTTQSLDIPEPWIGLVYIPLARIYAVRDQRLNESQLINKEYQQLLSLFRQHVQTFDHGAAKSISSRAPQVAVPQQGE